MKLELYYKHKELIDKIISSKLSGKIMLIDNELYVKMDDRILNPMDLYYYNIKKLKEENNKIKELLKFKND